jgi:DNA-binding NarL/FixJ family response regulator
MLRLTPKNVLAREEAALSYLKVERPTDGSRIICKVLSKRIMALSADRIDRAALDSTTRRVMEILYCFAVGDLGLKDSEIARYLRYTPRNIRLRREAAIRKITKAIELKRSRDLL